MLNTLLSTGKDDRHIMSINSSGIKKLSLDKLFNSRMIEIKTEADYNLLIN